MLPILHLNGYKIANPTVLARIPEDELVKLLEGYGHQVLIVEGNDPEIVHRAFAAALDEALDAIGEIQREARAAPGAGPRPGRPRWPMIVLRTPKGWTGPKVVDGVQVEDTFRAHQVPVSNARDDDDHRAILETWLRSYRPEELFDDQGASSPSSRELAPAGAAA